MMGSGGSSTVFPIIGWRLLVLQPLRWLQKHHPSCSSREGTVTSVVAWLVVLSLAMPFRTTLMPNWHSVGYLDVSPNVHWRNVSHVLVSLDWNPQEGLATLEHLLTKIKQEPCEFAALAHPEVSKMVHVQLRLSFCGVAEVKGPINETCVKILAELLGYKLKTVKFQSVQELQIEISDFEAKANYRGTLVLVTDVPASAGKILRGPHRMLLCYSAE